MSELTREAWLLERRKGLCSTDAAAVAGLSAWRTPLHVFLDKRGLLPPTPVSQEMRWGTLLEPTIALAYQEETGLELMPPPRLIRSDRHPWMLASLDRLTADGSRIVELKTSRTAQGWGDPGTDEIPQQYLLQVQHQLCTAGLELADVAVLIGGSDFRIYHLQRHEALLSSLVEIESRFWEDCQAGVPPEPDWQHPRTAELVIHLHGIQKGKVISLGLQEQVWAETYLSLGEQIRDLEGHRDQLKARMLYAMGEAAQAKLSGLTLVRQSIRRKSYTVPESQYIQFRIKKEKE